MEPALRIIPHAILRSYIQFQTGFNDRGDITYAQAREAMVAIMQRDIHALGQARDLAAVLVAYCRPLGGERGPAAFQIYITQEVVRYFLPTKP